MKIILVMGCCFNLSGFNAPQLASGKFISSMQSNDRIVKDRIKELGQGIFDGQ